MAKQAEPDPTDPTPQKESRPGKWADTFFEALANSGVVRAATEAAKIDRSVVYDHRAHNAAFRRRWDEALDKGIDLLEFAARKLALEGNPTMLIFLLKCHRPAIYQDSIRIQHEMLTATVEAERIADDLGLEGDERQRAVAETVRLLAEARE